MGQQHLDLAYTNSAVDECWQSYDVWVESAPIMDRNARLEMVAGQAGKPDAKTDIQDLEQHRAYTTFLPILLRRGARSAGMRAIDSDKSGKDDDAKTNFLGACV